jgi:hypothetical protein
LNPGPHTYYTSALPQEHSQPYVKTLKKKIHRKLPPREKGTILCGIVKVVEFDSQSFSSLMLLVAFIFNSKIRQHVIP